MELSVLAQHGLMVAIAALILPGMIVNWVSGLRILWAAATDINTMNYHKESLPWHA